jgi:hypothetical protein
LILTYPDDGRSHYLVEVGDGIVRSGPAAVTRAHVYIGHCELILAAKRAAPRVSLCAVTARAA